MSNEQPELVQEFSDTAESLDDQVEKLEQFQAELDEYTEQVESMGSTEQTAFYEGATTLVHEAENIDTVDELLSLEEDIEGAIRSPLEQVARESIEQFLSTVNPELTNDKQSRIFQKLSDKLPNELETIAETHQSLIPKVSDLPPHLQDLVASRIEDTTSYLLAPHEDIEPFVEKLQQRYALLSDIETAFEDAGSWAPPVEFTHDTALYSADTPRWDADDVRGELSKIQAELDSVSGSNFSLDELVKSELHDVFGEFNLADATSNLRDVRRDLDMITSLYEQLEAKATILDEFGTNRGVFEETIDDILAQYNQLPMNQYDSLADFKDELDELDDDIDDFIEDIVNRLNAQRKMVDSLKSDTESERPDINIGPDDHSPILPFQVQEDMEEALEDCQSYNEWIDTALETWSDEIDREDMIEVWQTLSGGQHVPLSDENEDVILALADKLSLGVILRGE